MFKTHYFSQNEGTALVEFEESQTIQNDVPTLAEILKRYQETGEVLTKPLSPIYDDQQYMDTTIIQPDVEDLNAEYQLTASEN